MSAERVVFVCPDCGGDNVSATAWTRWSVARQRWEIEQADPPQSREWCSDCEGECRVVPVPVLEDGSPDVSGLALDVCGECDRPLHGRAGTVCPCPVPPPPLVLDNPEFLAEPEGGPTA